MILKQKKEKPLYFIGIVCPEPLQGEITSFKNYFLEKYNCRCALKAPAHTTLIPPFRMEEEPYKMLTDMLRQFNSTIKPFDITLSGFGHFDKRTIFVKPVPNPSLINLYNDLRDKLSSLIPMNEQEKKFNPHITIANRDLKQNDYRQAWEYFKVKTFEREFTCKQISLLKLGIKWEEERY